MKKFALLAVVALFVAADVAQAGVFRRGGGCPGGTCSVNLAAAPAPAPAIAETRPVAPPTEVAGTDGQTTQPVVAATTESSERSARLRIFSRRR